MTDNRPYFALRESVSESVSAEEIKEKLARQLAKLQAEEKTNQEKIKEKYEKQLRDLQAEEQRQNDVAKKAEAQREIERLKNIEKIEQNKASSQVKAIERQQNLYESNPDQYTKLYNLHTVIKDETVKNTATGNEANTSTSSIGLDPVSGDLNLKIQMFKPAGIDMEVVDGQVRFSPDNMDVEKMTAMIDFLSRHGLVVDVSNLKLENADKKTQDTFAQSVKNSQNNLQTANSSGFMTGSADGEEDESLSDENNEAEEMIENDNKNDLANAEAEAKAGATPADDENEEQSQPQAQPSSPVKSAPKKKTQPIDLTANKKAADDSITAWLNKNKRKGFSWTDGVILSGGWTSYTAYPNESNDRNRKPVTIDSKTKQIKYNYEFRLYTRIKDGRLDICYSVPPGKTLTPDQAYLIASAFADAGISKVDFGNMSDANEAIMREACAKKMIVPLGHKIGFDRYDKMVKAAATKVDENSPKMYRYKYDLAMQMNKLLQAKGINYAEDKNRNNPDCRRVRWAIGAYNLHPFRDLWEDFKLRDTFEQKIADAETNNPRQSAPQVIGATKAVSSLYKMYNDGSARNLEYLLSPNCKTMNNEEKSALRNYVTNHGIPSDTPVRSLDPKAFIAVYNEMCKTQEKQAKKDIEDEYLSILRDNKAMGTDTNPKTAISKYMGKAREEVENMNEELADCQLPKIFLKRSNNPEYDFADVKKQAQIEGLLKGQERSSNNNSGNNTNNSNNSNRNRNGGRSGGR